MNLADGAKSWVIFPCLMGIVSGGISLMISGVFGSILLFFSILFLLITGFFLMFFRDPERVIGTGIVAAADGRIREVCSMHDENIGVCTRVSTFMNLYNVHVNRIPIDGVVKDIIHIRGSYLPAFKKESEKNERVIITLETTIGVVKLVQIAGTLARRIVPYVKPGDKVKKGERIGIIRLGSRVDVYVPSPMVKQIMVGMNDRVKAGVDTIAEIDV